MEAFLYYVDLHLFCLILIHKSTLPICLILFIFLIYLFILFVILHFNMVGSPRLITFRYSQLVIRGACLNYIGFRDIWALIYRSCYNNISLLKYSDMSGQWVAKNNNNNMLIIQISYQVHANSVYHA